MRREAQTLFSSPVFEVVSATFALSLGELICLYGTDEDLRMALHYAGVVARETVEAYREAGRRRDGRSA
jgi:hypothetical protein